MRLTRAAVWWGVQAALGTAGLVLLRRVARGAIASDVVGMHKFYPLLTPLILANFATTWLCLNGHRLHKGVALLQVAVADAIALALLTSRFTHNATRMLNDFLHALENVECWSIAVCVSAALFLVLPKRVKTTECQQ